MNNLEQIWKIRDSRGLDTYEKNFLMTIASRGEAGMFCEWARNCADMSMKKDRYYKTRNSLMDKKLITAQEQSYGPTIYKINDEALVEWHSVTQNAELPVSTSSRSARQNRRSVTQNDRSATQNARSVSPEGKKNIKINKKKNLEELEAPAGAATSPIDSNKNNKEDQEVAPASPMGTTVAADPMEVTTKARSVTQNGVPDWQTAPVVIEEKPRCAKCDTILIKGLCWECGA